MISFASSYRSDLTLHLSLDWIKKSSPSRDQASRSRLNSSYVEPFVVGVVGLLSLQDQHNCKTDITGRVRFCFVFELS